MFKAFISVLIIGLSASQLEAFPERSLSSVPSSALKPVVTVVASNPAALTAQAGAQPQVSVVPLVVSSTAQPASQPMAYRPMKNKVSASSVYGPFREYKSGYNGMDSDDYYKRQYANANGGLVNGNVFPKYSDDYYKYGFGFPSGTFGNGNSMPRYSDDYYKYANRYGAAPAGLMNGTVAVPAYASGYYGKDSDDWYKYANGYGYGKSDDDSNKRRAYGSGSSGKSSDDWYKQGNSGYYGKDSDDWYKKGSGYSYGKDSDDWYKKGYANPANQAMMPLNGQAWSRVPTPVAAPAVPQQMMPQAVQQLVGAGVTVGNSLKDKSN